LPRSKAIRVAAWGVVAAGIAAPLVRRRLRLRPPVVLATAAAAPIALCVALPRSHQRDAAAVALQMWAYLAGYEMPADDPEQLHARVRVDYPVTIDRALGLGVPPSLRLQRALAAPRRIRNFDKPFVWAHWVWFFVPHGSMLYHLLAHRDRFPRAVGHLYATFDIGLIGYWVLPTAPPWYAAERGRMSQPGYPPLRRMMVEYGQEFWGDGWPRLYGSLGGNPVAAMPSLHFATSLMVAHLLTDIGPVHGVVGWSYALTLGFALVYLGEHYVVDLLAGAALTESVRAVAPRVSPAVSAASRMIQRLETIAHRE